MAEKEKKHHRFGLVGKDIEYSFSRGYFSEKFEKLELPNHSYENFDLAEINEFTKLIQENSNLNGLNVTIPYKEEVIPFLTRLNEDAEKIGAVNTIKFHNNQLIGFNTDVYGFQKSIEPHLKGHHKKALILGSGGASKAVSFVFSQLGITYKIVSRKPAKEQLSYEDLNEVLSDYQVIVNCTPLGTHPDIDEKPQIPYHLLTPKHLLFDLIYNPPKTAFLLEGESQGAAICNGNQMLKFQAEKSWEIWTNNAST